MTGTGKDKFIASMGGPSATVGTSTVTVEQLACMFEEILRRLTFPGHRTYAPQTNKDIAWRMLNSLDD
jgi:hypothetical protein